MILCIICNGIIKIQVLQTNTMVFPVLIQELAKGLYEFLSINEDDPEDVRKYAYDKGDTVTYRKPDESTVELTLLDVRYVG